MIEISVSNLVKEFEVGKKILDGLTFQVDTGERVGLLGPNGCGKTTLLRILTGAMDYDEGDVIHVYREKLSLIKARTHGRMNLIDMGIMLAHLYVSHPETFRFFREARKEIYGE